MKKVLATLAVVALVAGFASCDKQCDCKTTVTGPNGDKNVTENQVDLEKLYGSDTKKKCKDLNSDNELMGYRTVVKCH